MLQKMALEAAAAKYWGRRPLHRLRRSDKHANVSERGVRDFVRSH